MRSIWVMVQHHGWDYEAIMNMVAWERQIFTLMTMAYVREENERIKLERQTRK
jgi:hypothetical protein